MAIGMAVTLTMALGLVAQTVAASGAPTQDGDGGTALVAPLFPDGSLLKRAQGQVSVDQQSGIPVFVLWDRDLSGAERRLWLMPCASTDELVRLQSREGGQQLIELSGLVTASQGQNWLLPAVANLGGTTLTAKEIEPPIPPGGRRRVATPLAPDSVTTAPPAATTPAPPADGERPDVDAPAVVALAPETIADELEAMLDQAVPVVPRSADAGAPTVAPLNPTEQERGVISGAAGGSDASGPDVPGQRILERPTRVQDRRVTFVRDERTGAWRAVFAGRSAGLPSSAQVLPCARLDAINLMARRAAPGSPFLVTGILTHDSHGCAYLLPTMARPLRSGKWILP